MKRYTWEMFDEDIAALATMVNECRGDLRAIYGEPRGGLIPAVALSHRLGLPMVSAMGPNVLWVDDIADTGKTLGNAFVSRTSLHCVLVRRFNCRFNVIHARIEPTNEWLVFPWEDYARANADHAQYAKERLASVT